MQAGGASAAVAPPPPPFRCRPACLAHSAPLHDPPGPRPHPPSCPQAPTAPPPAPRASRLRPAGAPSHVDACGRAGACWPGRAAGHQQRRRRPDSPAAAPPPPLAAATACQPPRRLCCPCVPPAGRQLLLPSRMGPQQGQPEQGARQLLLLSQALLQPCLAGGRATSPAAGFRHARCACLCRPALALAVSKLAWRAGRPRPQAQVGGHPGHPL